MEHRELAERTCRLAASAEERPFSIECGRARKVTFDGRLLQERENA